MASTMDLTFSPMQSGAIFTSLPRSSARRPAQGERENLSSGPSPLGRPKCEETWCMKNKDQFSESQWGRRTFTCRGGGGARICQQGRTYGNAGTLGDKILDGLDGGADTGVISDLLAVEGDVEVAADEHLHEEQESQNMERKSMSGADNLPCMP